MNDGGDRGGLDRPDGFDEVVRRLLVDHAPVILGRIDADERLVQVEGALLSRTPQWRDFVGRRVTDLLDDPGMVDGIRDALAGRPGHAITVMGGRPWLHVTRPMRDDSGQVTAAATLFTYADSLDAINQDVSLGRRLERAAVLNEQFRAVSELSRDMIAITRMDGRLIFLNRAGHDLAGIDEPLDTEELVVQDLFTPAARAATSEQYREAMRSVGSWRGLSELQPVDGGEAVPVAVEVFVVRRHADGQRLGVATVIRDLREQLATEAGMRANIAEQRALAELGRAALSLPLMAFLDEAVEILGSRFDSCVVGILRLSPREDVVEPISSNAGREVGPIALTRSTVTMRAMEENRLVSTEDVVTDDRFAGGPVATSMSMRSAMVSPVPGTEARPWGFVGISHELPRTWTEDEQTLTDNVAAIIAAAVNRDNLEKKLAYQALHDPLTGLPNRALVTDRIAHALDLAARKQTTMAVLVLDLDDFKTINDTLGHAHGDELLAELARRFTAVVRDSDTVARIGGDEFVVLCEDLRSPEDAAFIAESLLGACRTEVVVSGRPVSVTGSVGVALALSGEGSTPTLLGDADIAMYRAKRDRPDTYRIFDEAMRRGVVGRGNVATQLRAAVRAGELEPAYQPIVDLATGRVVAFEALARWRDQDGQQVPPDVFIPIAEEIGLIGELGALMLRRAVGDAAGWTGLGEIGVRVNTSAHELRDRAFFDRVTATLAEARLPPHLLGLEITESVLVKDDTVTNHTLQLLRETGVHLLVDDFGTGFCSLSYLNRFPIVDVLKIDRSFLEAGTRGRAVVEAVMGLGRAFGLRVCAEGVETREQHAWVAGLGCDLAQGYLFGRPVPASGVRPMLEAWGPLA